MYPCQVTSEGKFLVGPNQAKLRFISCICTHDGDNGGFVELGDLWQVHLNMFDDHESIINLDNIKKFVKNSGIKGVGVHNKNRNRKDYYGYYDFTYDLTMICLGLVKQDDQWGNPLGWGGSGGQEDVIDDILNTLQEGDTEQWLEVEG